MVGEPGDVIPITQTGQLQGATKALPLSLSQIRHNDVGESISFVNYFEKLRSRLYWW